MNQIQIFSPSELSKESFKELLPDFFEEFNTDYKLLNEAFESNNAKILVGLAHKMKGTAASYSAVLIFNKAKILQEAIEREDTSHLTSKINDLGIAIQKSYNYAQHNFGIE
jgi:HPt (histidine-containing phosphotransfer) domain-containing protein